MSGRHRVQERRLVNDAAERQHQAMLLIFTTTPTDRALSGWGWGVSAGLVKHAQDGTLFGGIAAEAAP